MSVPMCRMLALLPLLISFPAAAQDPAPPLELVETVWPPFTNVAGEARFATDLVAEALERIGVRSETAIVEASDLTPVLLEGRVSGSAALWRSPERERVLIYSEPYMENRMILVGRRGADVAARRLADLRGRRVGLVRGYAYGETVENAEGLLFVPARDDEASLEKLLDGEVDYILVDELVIRYILDHYAEQAEEHLQVGTTPMLKRSLHFAIRKDLPDAESIVERFNEEIRRMMADGTYNRILQLEWIRADIDADGRSELVFSGVRAGKLPPVASYDIVSTETNDESGPRRSGRFVIGGELYEGWNEVPDSYKLPPLSGADGHGTTAPVFRFRWGGKHGSR